jgi:hypothetical protein
MKVNGNMRFQKYTWLTLGTVHLVLVAIGAGHLSFWNLGEAGSWLQSYGEFTGSSRTYTFFAPGVADSVRARFDLYGEDGELVATDSLQPGTTREANLRVINIIEYLQNDLDDNNYRHLLALSWTGKMFARHPSAVSAVLRVETFDVPSMKEFREGLRYDWEPIYQAKFARKRRSE